MKKYLLLGTSLIVASSAYAEFDCTKQPTCADLGFTMSATDCAGKNMLKCPFETDKVFCTGESSGGNAGTGQGCDAVGDVLYSDLNCYDEASIPSGKVTPIAVVFDVDNKLAVALNDAPRVMDWASVNKDTPLPNYETAEEALAAKETGKENTATLIALGGDYASSDYAPGYCYNLTEGGQPVGSWFLPSARELRAMYDNKTTLNTALTNVEGSKLTEGIYWSFSEYESETAWSIFMINGKLYGTNHYKDASSCVRCAIAY